MRACCAVNPPFPLQVIAGGADDLQEVGSPAERLRWEQVLSYAPDVIMVNLCNPTLERTLGELQLLACQPGFWALPAVKANQVFVCDHSLFSRPGPRLADGAELMARIFHPVRTRGGPIVHPAGAPPICQDAWADATRAELRDSTCVDDSVRRMWVESTCQRACASSSACRRGSAAGRTSSAPTSSRIRRPGRPPQQLLSPRSLRR